MVEVLFLLGTVLLTGSVQGISVRSYNRNFDFSSSTPGSNDFFQPYPPPRRDNEYPRGLIHRTTQSTRFTSGPQFGPASKSYDSSPSHRTYLQEQPSLPGAFNEISSPGLSLNDPLSLGGILGNALTSVNTGFKEVRPGVFAKTVATTRNGDLTVHKNVFLHVGPGYVPPPTPPKKVEKHYKLIFIKTPYTPSQKVILPEAKIPEEKTLVYVLSETPKTPKVPILKIKNESLQRDPPSVFLINYQKDGDFKTRELEGSSFASATPLPPSKPLSGNQLYRKRSPEAV